MAPCCTLSRTEYTTAQSVAVTGVAARPPASGRHSQMQVLFTGVGWKPPRKRFSSTVESPHLLQRPLESQATQPLYQSWSHCGRAGGQAGMVAGCGAASSNPLGRRLGRAGQGRAGRAGGCGVLPAPLQARCCAQVPPTQQGLPLSRAYHLLFGRCPLRPYRQGPFAHSAGCACASTAGCTSGTSSCRPGKSSGRTAGLGRGCTPRPARGQSPTPPCSGCSGSQQRCTFRSARHHTAPRREGVGAVSRC